MAGILTSADYDLLSAEQLKGLLNGVGSAKGLSKKAEFTKKLTELEPDYGKVTAAVLRDLLRKRDSVGGRRTKEEFIKRLIELNEEGTKNSDQPVDDEDGSSLERERGGNEDDTMYDPVPPGWGIKKKKMEHKPDTEHLMSLPKPKVLEGCRPAWVQRMWRGALPRVANWWEDSEALDSQMDVFDELDKSVEAEAEKRGYDTSDCKLIKFPREDLKATVDELSREIDGLARDTGTSRQKTPESDDMKSKRAKYEERRFTKDMIQNELDLRKIKWEKGWKKADLVDTLLRADFPDANWDSDDEDEAPGASDPTVHLRTCSAELDTLTNHGIPLEIITPDAFKKKLETAVEILRSKITKDEGVVATDIKEYDLATARNAKVGNVGQIYEECDEGVDLLRESHEKAQARLQEIEQRIETLKAGPTDIDFTKLNITLMAALGIAATPDANKCSTSISRLSLDLTRWYEQQLGKGTPDRTARSAPGDSGPATAPSTETTDLFKHGAPSMVRKAGRGYRVILNVGFPSYPIWECHPLSSKFNKAEKGLLERMIALPERKAWDHVRVTACCIVRGKKTATYLRSTWKASETSGTPAGEEWRTKTELGGILGYDYVKDTVLPDAVKESKILEDKARRGIRDSHHPDCGDLYPSEKARPWLMSEEL